MLDGVETFADVEMQVGYAVVSEMLLMMFTHDDCHAH